MCSAGPLHDKVCVPVVANIKFLIAGITPIIPSEPSTIQNVRSRASLDGHAAVAHTSPVGLDAVLDAELLIDRQLVLVVPKPNSRPMNQLRQLPRRNLIPTPKRGVRPVMRQQNQSAFVSVRIHGGLQPGEQGLGNSAPRLERRRLAKPFAPLQHWHFPPVKTSGIVAGVQSNDAPVPIFEAKEARPLSRTPFAVAAFFQSHPRQNHFPVAVSVSVHFVIAIECEAAFRAHRPLYRCIRTRFLPKEVFSHFIVVAYVIHISQVNREIRLGFFYGCRDYSRFIRPCAPIAPYADLHAVIDRISPGSFSMRRVISDRVPLTKPVFRNPRYPLEKPVGKESRDGSVGRGGIPRPRSVEMSCNSRICEPCKVSEVLAGACLVGRPASALGALLGFNTHLDGPQRRLL